MARYTSDHKDKTRAHLVETARREFRRSGFEPLSIDKLMRAAGLTRGGFYAHFASKEALVEEVLGLESGLLRCLRQIPAGPSAPTQVSHAMDRYLEPTERAGRVDCPLVAHPMDALRGGPERASLYAEQVEGIIQSVRSAIAAKPDAEREAVILTVLAVGAAILGASIPDDAAAERIELTCRDEIRRRLIGRTDSDAAPQTVAGADPAGDRRKTSEVGTS